MRVLLALLFLLPATASAGDLEDGLAEATSILRGDHGEELESGLSPVRVLIASALLTMDRTWVMTCSAGRRRGPGRRSGKREPG